MNRPASSEVMRDDDSWSRLQTPRGHGASIRRKAVVWTSRIAGLGLAWALFVWLLAPPFLSWDSHHYLRLGLRPEVGGLHPSGFGLVLRGLAIAARPLWENAFSHLLVLYHLLCLVAATTLCLWEIRRAPRPSARLPRALGFWLVGGVFLMVVGPALVFLANGFWTETTAISLAVAVAWGAARHLERPTWRGGGILALATAFGYHVRYQMMVVPVAIVVAGLFFAARRAKGERAFELGKSVRLAVAMAAAIFLSSSVGARFFGDQEATAAIRARLLKASIQCRLDCAVAFFETDCSTPEGRELVEASMCVGLSQRAGPLGPLRDTSVSLAAIFREAGWANTLRWLLVAPAAYLDERHPSMEYGGFKFDREVYLLSRDTAFVDYYAPLFAASARRENGSPAFRMVIDWLELLFLRSPVVRVVAGLAAFASVAVVVASRSRTAVLLALFAIGNFLLFAYFNAQASLRYLMTVMGPGTAAVAIALAHDVCFRLEGSPAPEGHVGDPSSRATRVATST